MESFLEAIEMVGNEIIDLQPQTIERIKSVSVPVKLQVFDITGALVKTLLNEGVRAGNTEVVWDGTNQSGVKVASGMYLYRLESSTFVAAKKMLLLK